MSRSIASFKISNGWPHRTPATRRYDSTLLESTPWRSREIAPRRNVQIRKGQEAEGAWFGYEPDYVPFKAVPTNDPALLATARAHLTQAIALYREVVQMDPDNLTAKLGYAGVSISRAIEVRLFPLIDRCFPTPGRRNNASSPKPGSPCLRLKTTETISQRLLRPSPRLDHTITLEAAGYLLPLLGSREGQG